MIVQSNHLNKPKVFLTHGLLPKYVDSEQLPAKDKPWSVILRHRWVSSVSAGGEGDFHILTWRR